MRSTMDRILTIDDVSEAAEDSAYGAYGAAHDP